MSRLVTRCPYCDTSFRVTEEQLSVARGSVRCGACLSVFTATQYLVEDEPGLVDEANPAEDTDDATPWQAEAEIEDDLPDYHEPDPIWDDEPVIEGIVEDDEAEADDLTGEASDEPSEIEEIDAPDTTQLENISLIDDEFGPDAYRGEVNVDAVADEIVLEYQPEPHRHYLAWAGASLAMVALLTLQLAWFNKDRLAEQPEFRGYYESICRVLGCSLPVFSDPSALHTTHLVVRTHPSVARALAVDAMIRNDAPWRQRFPDITLRFSDVHGDPVALRTFTPAEYLAGEMTGLKFIPARTEVRISLGIVDPGPSATSYSMVVDR